MNLHCQMCATIVGPAALVGGSLKERLISKTLKFCSRHAKLLKTYWLQWLPKILRTRSTPCLIEVDDFLRAAKKGIFATLLSGFWRVKDRICRVQLKKDIEKTW